MFSIPSAPHPDISWIQDVRTRGKRQGEPNLQLAPHCKTLPSKITVS